MAGFFQQALDGISSLSQVKAAGAVSSLPFIKMDREAPFTIEGKPPPTPGTEPSAYYAMATEDYFKAAVIPLLRGRFFTRFDNQDAPPVVLINETMARRYWPGEDPIGKKILTRYNRPKVREIVGVVGDVKHTGLDSDPRTEIFLPLAQNPFGSMTFVVRTSSDPLALLPAVKNQIWAVNSTLPLARVATMEQLISDSLKERRFSLLLLGLFAAIALLLAGLGLYGLISYSTSQRIHEIGIRMAVGAQTLDIYKLIIGQGLKLVLLGVGIGLLAAFVLTRLLKSLLFGITSTDSVTFISVTALLIVVALLASYAPARRATKLDPTKALRYE